MNEEQRKKVLDLTQWLVREKDEHEGDVNDEFVVIGIDTFNATLTLLDSLLTSPPVDVDAVNVLTASALAHRGCCGSEHDPANGKLHGHCVVCGIPWPCDTAKRFLAPIREVVDQTFNLDDIYGCMHGNIFSRTITYLAPTTERCPHCGRPNPKFTGRVHIPKPGKVEGKS